MDLRDIVPHACLYIFFSAVLLFLERKWGGGRGEKEQGMTCVAVHCTRMDLLKGLQYSE